MKSDNSGKAKRSKLHSSSDNISYSKSKKPRLLSSSIEEVSSSQHHNKTGLENPSLDSEQYNTSTNKSDIKRNRHGETLLIQAAKKGELDQITSLISNGCDVNQCDFAGWTALHESCIRDFSKITLALLKAGANVNKRGMNGDTALHDASRCGFVDTLRVLMRFSADPNVENDDGKTAFDVATKSEVKDIMKRPKAFFQPKAKDSRDPYAFVDDDDDSNVAAVSMTSSLNNAKDVNSEDSRKKTETMEVEDRGVDATMKMKVPPLRIKLLQSSLSSGSQGSCGVAESLTEVDVSTDNKKPRSIENCNEDDKTSKDLSFKQKSSSEDESSQQSSKTSDNAKEMLFEATNSDASSSQQKEAQYQQPLLISDGGGGGGDDDVVVSNLAQQIRKAKRPIEKLTDVAPHTGDVEMNKSKLSRTLRSHTALVCMQKTKALSPKETSSSSATSSKKRSGPSERIIKIESSSSKATDDDASKGKCMPHNNNSSSSDEHSNRKPPKLSTNNSLNNDDEEEVAEGDEEELGAGNAIEVDQSVLLLRNTSSSSDLQPPTLTLQQSIDHIEIEANERDDKTTDFEVSEVKDDDDDDDQKFLQICSAATIKEEKTTFPESLQRNIYGFLPNGKPDPDFLAMLYEAGHSIGCSTSYNNSNPKPFRMTVAQNPYSLELELRKKKDAIIDEMIATYKSCATKEKCPRVLSQSYLTKLPPHNIIKMEKRRVPDDLCNKAELSILFKKQEERRFNQALKHQTERENLCLADEQECLNFLNNDCPFSKNLLNAAAFSSFLDNPMMPIKKMTVDRHQQNQTTFSTLDEIKKFYEIEKRNMLCRHLHEAESLMMVQRLEWEVKLKDMMIHDWHTNLLRLIPNEHVPMVEVPRDFILCNISAR